jgi:hypothetical protein
MKIAAAFDRAREHLPEGVFEESLLRAGGGDGQSQRHGEEEAQFHDAEK